MGETQGNYIEVDLDTLNDNISFFKKFNPTKKFIAVVKDNAYGHGAIEVAKVCLDNGASLLCTSSLTEAIELRQNFYSVPILVLGHIECSHLHLAIENNISVTIHNVESYLELQSVLSSKVASVHLKINSGLNRIGFSDKMEFDFIYNEIIDNEFLNLAGIYSHFQNPSDSNSTAKQILFFKNITSSVNFDDIEFIHLSNSESSKRDIALQNAFRVGIGLYGLSEGTRPIMSLHSKIISLNKHHFGSCISYGNSYVTRHNEIIATIPIGYGHGFSKLNEKSFVICDNRKFRIAGKICMDMLMFSCDETLKIGDKVTLFDGVFSPTDISRLTGQLDYEILVNISKKIPILYKKR